MLIDKTFKLMERPDINIDTKLFRDAPFFRLDEATGLVLASKYREISDLSFDPPPEFEWELPKEAHQQWHLPFPVMTMELGTDSRQTPGRAACCISHAVEEGPNSYYFTLGVGLGLPEVLFVSGRMEIQMDNDLPLAFKVVDHKASLCYQRHEMELDFTQDFIGKVTAYDKHWLATDGKYHSYREMDLNGLAVDESMHDDHLNYNLAHYYCQEFNACMLAILWINRPSHFIVEETPARWATRPPKLRKVINSTKKPHFICISPERIRQRYIPDPDRESTGRKTGAHQRRGHWRLYSNERYRNLKGKRQWIDAVWIGPKEGVVGKNRYVVRLDK